MLPYLENEIRQFIRDNLTVGLKVEPHGYTSNSVYVTVELKVGDDVISTATESIHIPNDSDRY